MLSTAARSAAAATALRQFRRLGEAGRARSRRILHCMAPRLASRLIELLKKILIPRYFSSQISQMTCRRMLYRSVTKRRMTGGSQ